MSSSLSHFLRKSFQLKTDLLFSVGAFFCLSRYVSPRATRCLQKSPSRPTGQLYSPSTLPSSLVMRA